MATGVAGALPELQCCINGVIHGRWWRRQKRRIKIPHTRASAPRTALTIMASRGAGCAGEASVVIEGAGGEEGVDVEVRDAMCVDVEERDAKGVDEIEEAVSVGVGVGALLKVNGAVVTLSSMRSIASSELPTGIPRGSAMFRIIIWCMLGAAKKCWYRRTCKVEKSA